MIEWLPVFRFGVVAAFLVLAGCSLALSEPEPARPRSVWAIGDSIMVGAEAHLDELVPGIALDAEPGRPVSAGITALEGMLATGDVPEVLVFALGTNAGATLGQLEEVMELATEIEEVVFVNVTVPRDWEDGTNAAIADVVDRYENATLVDWNDESRGQSRLFRSDGFHPNPTGSESWANLIVIEVKSR